MGWRVLHMTIKNRHALRGNITHLRQSKRVTDAFSFVTVTGRDLHPTCNIILQTLFTFCATDIISHM